MDNPRKGDVMTNGRWGHCKHCKHFDSPARIPVDQEEAQCRQALLSKHELRTFGASGGNLYQLRKGLSERVERPSFTN
jgi:hypothetical protein